MRTTNTTEQTERVLARAAGMVRAAEKLRGQRQSRTRLDGGNIRSSDRTSEVQIKLEICRVRGLARARFDRTDVAGTNCPCAIHIAHQETDRGRWRQRCAID